LRNFKLRTRVAGSIFALATVLLSAPHPSGFAQSQPASPYIDKTGPRPAGTANLPFDPHDFTGDWYGDRVSRNSRWANKTPEPPLTDWAKEHLLYKSISHDALAGTLRDPKNPPNESLDDSARAYYATDLYGVIANDPFGMYPGKDCEPHAAPAMYDVPYLGVLTFFMSPERIVQLNNHQREWRIFWLNQNHPKEMDPTFEGDSVAHWEGNTLVVDTIGYNGRSMITGVVGHSMSDAFRLVERYTRVDHDNMVIDMTYYDPKAWGDKAWTGFHRYYRLVPIQQVHDLNYKSDSFTEWICSPEDNLKFDQKLIERYKKQ